MWGRFESFIFYLSDTSCQHFVVKYMYVSDLQKVYLQVLQFPLPIKLTATI